jgi:adenine-specific DNA-methyltransferase
MEFNKAYDREEFLTFLKDKFLPEEDFVKEETVLPFPVQTKYSTKATRLGTCHDTLDLEVYEIRHTSKHDARVGLSKEAFRLLAEEGCARALVLFVPEDDNSNYRFSLIEITLNIKEDSSKIDKSYSDPHRYSYYLGKGIAYHTPNKYLNEKGRVVDEDDLRERFSVEVLTKEFYSELSDWYAWAIQIIRFPNNINDNTDDAKYNNEGAIRLITRLIFVWFLKQRHLIPDEFFDESFIANNLLEGFTPHAVANLFGKSYDSKYYKAILQNLFFAMLNSPITAEGGTELSERHFRNGRGDYDNNKLMRYEDYFSNPQLFVELANKTVPFLNGGLFDCLDDKDNGMYYDGFSDRESVRAKLAVPDFLFFGEEVGKNIDLSEFYGDKKKKKVSARGIIDILKRYNFTVEENTPFDQEVSLDPELLGKVFENLLASYNPETQTTARKQTGSFYTPREIVQYMVEESLVAHLKRTVGEEYESEYRQLMEYSDDEIKLSDEIKHQIITSLYNCKILDPACGSGAFPMGMLQQMVHILSRLDPNNEQWRKIMLDDAIAATSDAYRNSTDDERKEIVADIERSFDEAINRPDYARKLYLIENCIYGVDIQPIAIQISKLRFFISLVVDQITNTDATDNFGIRPLPNLEAKFVAANTLIGLKSELSLADNSDTIIKLKQQLKTANHKIFSAKTVRTKRKYKQIVCDLRQSIANELNRMGFIDESETQQLASWDMFNQNASSSFFDKEWMFGMKEGFDIAIGNPPYGVSIKGNYRKDVVAKLGNVPDYEIYYYFIQIAERLIKDNGILSYIIPNTYLFNTFANKYRVNILKKWNVIEILDCTKFPIFEKAVVRNTINTWQKGTCDNNFVGYRNTTDISSFNELLSKKREYMSQGNLLTMNQNWGLAFYLSSSTICIIHKMETSKSNIMQLFPNISQGLIAYDKYQGQSADIIKNRAYHYSEYKKGLKEWLWGEDVTRYSVNWNGQEYIDYCEGIANPREPIYFKGNRLLVREITNPSIYAAITDKEQYNDPSIIIVKDNPFHSIKCLLGILNSKLATFYHFNHSPKATKGAFPKILVQDIKEFPLPVINEKDKTTIDFLVSKIISMKQEDNCVDTTSEEREIDRLVYKLYGLTYDEIKIVDPETPITNKEYER